MRTAYAAARSADTSSAPRSPGAFHNWRSSKFVAALSDAFGSQPELKGAYCLHKHSDTYRRKLGLNELLFDVAVVRAAKAEHTAASDLHYVTESIWAVESELAKSLRAAVVDFNKLVLASAPNKLFVGPIVHDQGKLKRFLAPVAGRCSGQVYAAFIPHPSAWDHEGPEKIAVWRWADSDWARAS